MIEKENKTLIYDMIYLVSCAINNRIPSLEKIQKIDLDNLFSVCNFHNLTAITAYALKSAGIVLSKEWKDSTEKAIRKNLLFDTEREHLFAFMEENAIWYMPLKGIILKDFYPQTGMRQMSDNDILYDINFSQKLKKYMEKRGYTAKNSGTVHDVYMKPPVYNFEMHKYLFDEANNKKLFEYYSDVKKRLVKDENKKYAYHFTDEDFYIYMIVHEHKHFSNGGTGLRSLVDRYMYLKTKAGDMNWDYIHSELKKLEIDDFECESRKLCMKIFTLPNLTQLSLNEKDLLDYYLFSGTYGTLENYVKNKMKKYSEKTGITSKAKYIFRRIFPSVEFYKFYSPFFYKHKILIPVAWLCRISKTIIFRNKRIIQELKIVFSQ